MELDVLLAASANPTWEQLALFLPQLGENCGFLLSGSVQTAATPFPDRQALDQPA